MVIFLFRETSLVKFVQLVMSDLIAKKTVDLYRKILFQVQIDAVLASVDAEHMLIQEMIFVSTARLAPREQKINSRAQIASTEVSSTLTHHNVIVLVVA